MPQSPHKVMDNIVQGSGKAGSRLRPEEQRGQEAAEPLPFFAFPAGVQRGGASERMGVYGGGPTGLAAEEMERVWLGWPGKGLRLLPWGTKTCSYLRLLSVPPPRYSFPGPGGLGSWVT